MIVFFPNPSVHGWGRGGGEKEAGMVIVKMETLPSLFCLPFAFPTKGIICHFCFKASKKFRLYVLHISIAPPSPLLIINLSNICPALRPHLPSF